MFKVAHVGLFFGFLFCFGFVFFLEKKPVFELRYFSQWRFHQDEYIFVKSFNSNELTFSD